MRTLKWLAAVLALTASASALPAAIAQAAPGVAQSATPSLTPGQTSPSLMPGQISPVVSCATDPSQTYALYLPRAYSPDMDWPLIMAFDPGGRGQTPVERYRAAADLYGYIVVGSNNSRNGPSQLGKIVSALTTDVFARFRINPRRIYTAGMSGGARAALTVALSSQAIAGTIASSAGYLDGSPRKTLPFVLFMTTGTEDFNHLEMRKVDAALTTPHHLAVFEGGHAWLSSELAVEAVEWLEVQAARSARPPRSANTSTAANPPNGSAGTSSAGAPTDARINAIFAKRVAAARTAATLKDRYLALTAIVSDFDSLRDVAGVASEAATLGRNNAVRDAIRRDKDEDAREDRTLSEIVAIEARLLDDTQHTSAIVELKRRWKDLSDQAMKPEDSAERRLARRILGNLATNATTTDPDYLKVIGKFRLTRGRGTL